jgi:hypothetical protein
MRIFKWNTMVYNKEVELLQWRASKCEVSYTKLLQLKIRVKITVNGRSELISLCSDIPRTSVNCKALTMKARNIQKIKHYVTYCIGLHNLFAHFHQNNSFQYGRGEQWNKIKTLSAVLANKVIVLFETKSSKSTNMPSGSLITPTPSLKKLYTRPRPILVPTPFVWTSPLKHHRCRLVDFCLLILLPRLVIRDKSS